MIKAFGIGAGNTPGASRWSCAIPAAGGTVLLVAASPNARRCEVIGLYDGALRVRIKAPPLEGRANEALCDWLAGQMGVAKRSLSVQQGTTSRRKRVFVALPISAVEQWLDSLDIGLGEPR